MCANFFRLIDGICKNFLLCEMAGICDLHDLGKAFANLQLLLFQNLIIQKQMDFYSKK